MKILIIAVTATLLTINNYCQGQTWKEWFQQKKTQKEYLIQQVAALQVYLGYVKKGYEIAHQGLTIIGDLKDGDFNLHSSYFESLEHVNPAIQNFDKVDIIKALRRTALKDIRTLYEDGRHDDNFTADERKYIAYMCFGLRDRCHELASDLNGVTTSGELQMKDDERLRRINQLFAETRNIYVFTRSFGNDTRLLSLQRSKEMTDIHTIKKLHHVQP